VRGDLRGVGDREHVGHAGALEAGHDLGEPTPSARLRARLEHLEREALPGERAALLNELRAELRGDVLDHPIVRRRGGAQDRDAVRQQLEDPDEPPVVGPEVVAPEMLWASSITRRPELAATCGRTSARKPASVEPLGRNEEQVDLVA
jgi:hypothetical protein